MKRPSVAILVDDLIAWHTHGLQPTGIQRVVDELLTTALARHDIDAWPARCGGLMWPDGTRRLERVDRETLRWREPRLALTEATTGLIRVKNTVRRLPMPAPVWAFARSIYIRLLQRQRVRPDLIVAPGALWIGSMADDVARQAKAGSRVRIIGYDLIPLSHPEWVPAHLTAEFRAVFDLVTPVADRIVTLSQQAADAIIARYPATKDRIRVATPTLDAHASPVVDVEPAPVNGPYLFTLSTVEPRKNHRLMLDAWRIARQDPRLADAALVIAGRTGWQVDELEAEIARDAHELRVVRLTEVTDADAEALYAHCAATVHASLVEGLGLPARESVARGIHTLASSAIPRDGLPATAYELFDPADAPRLAELMVDALVNRRPRTPYVGTGRTGWEPVLSALVD